VKKMPTFNGKGGLNLLDVERLGLDICLEWDTETTSTDINYKRVQD